MAIDFFTLRQVTSLIEQKLEEAKRAVPKAYTAATDASGAFAGDIARTQAAQTENPKFSDKGIIHSTTAGARHSSAKMIHGTIAGHLKNGRGVAVFLHDTPEFGNEGELDRHYLVPHSDGSTYLIKGKKTIKVSSMSPGEHGFISIMPHGTGKKSIKPVGYIPAGTGNEQHIRTFDPEQVERTGLGKNFKMRIGGNPTLD
jgi:hypothetical protein